MTAPRLLDTSVLSHYFGSRAREKTPALVQYVDELLASDGPRISVVTMYELERGLRKLEFGGGGRRKRRLFTMFMSGTTVYGLDAADGAGWFLAAEIHSQGATRTPAVSFGEADLLIFATARVHGLTLVTSDHAFAECIRTLGLGEHVIELPLT